MLRACRATLGRSGEAWNAFCSWLSLSGLIAGGYDVTGWDLTGSSSLQKMLLGRSLWAFPILLASHSDGWSDVLRTDSLGTCKRDALWSAAAPLGTEGKVGICWDATGSLWHSKEELMLGYQCCSSWKHPGIALALLAASTAPFLLWLFLPFLQGKQVNWPLSATPGNLQNKQKPLRSVHATVL